jgi:hypothetical protein
VYKNVFCDSMAMVWWHACRRKFHKAHYSKTGWELRSEGTYEKCAMTGGTEVTTHPGQKIFLSTSDITSQRQNPRLLD